MVLAPHGCGSGEKTGRGAGGGAADAGVGIEHDAGRTTVEAPARRVVAVSDEVADLLVALDVEPVGFGSARVSGSVGERVGDAYYADIGEPVYLGDAASPSVERIAGLDPDLIVLGSPYTGDLYARVSEIAPTLSYSVTSSGWWRRPLADVGRATGREDGAERFITDYDARVAELRDRAAPVAETSAGLAVLYAPNADYTAVFDERAAPADPYAKLGFDLVAPAGVEIPDSGVGQVSPEAVSDLEADTVIVIRISQGGEDLDRLPLEDILGALEDSEGGPRVLRQVIDFTRPSSSPIADRQAIEQAAALLLQDRNEG